jgi:hypothetical protein
VPHWLISDIVYTYGSKLEMASPKFREPGDFLVYLVFVCATIVVGIPIYPSRFPNIFFTPHIICPHSAILTAIAVPGDEEDYPCTSTGPSFAYQSKDQFAVLAWWEVPLRKLVSIPLLHSGGCGSLHLLNRHTRFFLRGLNIIKLSNEFE